MTGPDRPTATAGSDRPAATAGSDRGAAMAGSDRGAAVAGSDRGAAVAGSERDGGGQVRPLTLTAATSAVGAVTLLPFALFGGDFALSVSPSATALLAYLGIVTTAVANALFYTGLRTTAGSVAVVLTLTEPLTAALVSTSVRPVRRSYH